MGGDFSIMDRLELAVQVIARWETLATLGVFVVFWLLVSYVANPWRPERRPRSISDSAPPPAPAEEEESSDLGDELPED